MTTEAESGSVESLTIEPMSESDLEEVLAVERVSFPGPWTRDGFITELKREPAVCLTARLEGRVAGYLVFWVLPPEIHILNIAVRPDLRYRGIGRTLLDYLFAYAGERGADRLFLEVRPSNVAARALYKRAGFLVTGKRPNYYAEEGEDAILLTKSL